MRSTSAHHVPVAAALALALALALGACSTGDVAVQSPATTPSRPTAPAESEPGPTPSSSGVDSSPEADDSLSSGSVVVQDGEVVAGGVVVVETLFSYPGVGLQLVDSVRNHDVPMVQALSMIIAGVYVVVNLIADVLSILLTPRARTAISS